MIFTDYPQTWETEDYPVAFTWAPEWVPGIPVPPDPTPGDPDAEPVVLAPRRMGRRYQVVLVEPVTGRKLTTLSTFHADSYETVLVGPNSLKGTASTWDPAWALLGAQRATVHGRGCYRLPEKGIDLVLYVEGHDGRVTAWDKLALLRPIDIGGGRVQIEAIGPEEIARLNTLGVAGTQDLYNGAGSFPTTSLTNWNFALEVGGTHSFTTDDPNDGVRALRVSGKGGVFAPPFVVRATNHKEQRFYAPSAVRSSSKVVAKVTVATLGTTQLIQEERMDSGADESSTEDEGWQPLVPSNVLPKGTTDEFIVQPHWYIDTAPGEYVDIDTVRPQQDLYTGSPGNEDLVGYYGRILRRWRDGETDGAGRVTQTPDEGRDIGIRSIIVHSVSGIERSHIWHDSDDVTIADAWDDLADGTDYWFDAAWNQHVSKRRGVDRRDIKLDEHTVLDASWTLDPAAQVTRFRALTGFGSGFSRVGISYDFDRGGYPVTSIVQVPPGLSAMAREAWAVSKAEWASRRQYSGAVPVRFDVGAQLTPGDGLLHAFSDGLLGEWGAVRVGGLAFDFDKDVCTVRYGLDPVVQL